MNITIKGTGSIIPAVDIQDIPDNVLNLAYPYFTMEPAPDGGLWFTLSPYVEVYDDEAVQTFLRELIPYVSSGKIECSLQIAPGHVEEWSYQFIGFDCYRSFRSGSCSSCTCINR